MECRNRPKIPLLMKIITTVLCSIFAVTAAAATPPPALQSTARRFVRNFASGRIEEASKEFDEGLKKEVPLSMLAELKHQIDRDYGVFLSVSETREKTEEGFRAVDVVARYEKAPATFRVVFDSEGRIGAIKFNPDAPKPDPKLEEAARAFFDDFMGGRLDLVTKRFDAKMRTDLPPATLARVAKQIAASYGEFQSVTGARFDAEGDSRIVELLAIYDKTPVAVRVFFDSEGLVSGLKIEPAK